MTLRPSISDYIDSLENPLGIFRTLSGPVVERDTYGEIALRAGNSGVLFTIRSCLEFPALALSVPPSALFPPVSLAIGTPMPPSVGGKITRREPQIASAGNSKQDLAGTGGRRFLKCWIRPNPHLRAIYGYVERHRPPLLPPARLLEAEMFVHSMTGAAGWVDVGEGEWIEGRSLAAETERAAMRSDTGRLGELAEAFDGLCRRLMACEWAHGDLKPDNIVVLSGSEPAELMLVDCDAMWIPELTGCRAAESGTPTWRHPARTAAHFSKRIDDYPAALISATLHALALSPALWRRSGAAEGAILVPTQVIEGRSAVWHQMLALFAEAGMERERLMTQALATSIFEEVAAAQFFV